MVTFGTTTEGVATLHCTPLTLTYFVKVSCKVALGLGVRLIRVGHHKVCLRVRVRVSFFFLTLTHLVKVSYGVVRGLSVPLVRVSCVRVRFFG